MQAPKKQKLFASDEDRKQYIARALELAEEGEIRMCDGCERYTVDDYMKTYHGSMSKEWSLCTSCQEEEEDSRAQNGEQKSSTQ
jgi:hypothetical protein